MPQPALVRADIRIESISITRSDVTVRLTGPLKLPSSLKLSAYSLFLGLKLFYYYNSG